MAKIAVLGGGTGMYIVLQGLKKYPHELVAINNMVSSGGSTGRLRDELGVSPMGNIRQSLLALSNTDKFYLDLFNYRFEAGELKGHNFGNISLAALEKTAGGLELAVDFASKFLKVQGTVIPVTLEKTDLCAELDGGEIIYGESNIDQLKYDVHSSAITDIFLEPAAMINPKLQEVLQKMEYIIIGPGDFYTILSYFLVEGMSALLRNCSAKIIYISNIINKNGLTTNFKLIDYLNLLEKYLNPKPVDYIIYNNKKLPEHMVKICQERDETFVEYNPKDFINIKSKLVLAELLSEEVYFTSHVDCINRSVVRHDLVKLAALINEIVTGKTKAD